MEKTMFSLIIEMGDFNGNNHVYFISSHIKHSSTSSSFAFCLVSVVNSFRKFIYVVIVQLKHIRITICQHIQIASNS
jgi:hypothetical protein